MVANLGKRFRKDLFKHNEKNTRSLQEDMIRLCKALNFCSGLSSAFDVYNEEEFFEVVLVDSYLVNCFRVQTDTEYLRSKTKQLCCF